MRSSLSHESDKNQTNREQSVTVPKVHQIVSFLENSDIFSIVDLQNIAYSYSVKDWQSTSKKILVAAIINTATQTDNILGLWKIILSERPYLAYKKSPEKFSRKEFELLCDILVNEFAYSQYNYLEHLLYYLQLLPDKIPGSYQNYYSYYVSQALKMIEKLDMTNHPAVVEWVKNAKKLKKKYSRKKRNRKIEQKIPNVVSTQQMQKLQLFLNNLCTDDIRTICQEYDVRSIGIKVTIETQVLLLLEYATNTNTFQQLVVSLHKTFPNYDLSEYGLEPIIRTPKNIKELRKFVDDARHPATVQLESCFKLMRLLSKISSQTHLKRVIQILGYKQLDEKNIKIDKLVLVANARSEIRLLLLAYELVSKTTISTADY